MASGWVSRYTMAGGFVTGFVQRCSGSRVSSDLKLARLCQRAQFFGCFVALSFRWVYTNENETYRRFFLGLAGSPSLLTTDNVHLSVVRGRRGGLGRNGIRFVSIRLKRRN